jgi:6-phosphogluconolactonase
MPPQLHTFKSEPDYATEAAQAIEDYLIDLLKSQRTVKLALSGGKGPIPVYKKLVENDRIPWSRVIIFLADERYAPLNSEDSNYHLISTLIEEKVKNLRKFYSYNTKEPLETIVHWYDQTLKLQESPLFDLVILGLGADGHTASLFPGCGALHEKKRLVAHTRPLDLNGLDRMSLTFPALLDSQKIIFLIRGAAKSEVVDRWLSGEATIDEIPATGVLGHKDIEVFYDQSK